MNKTVIKLHWPDDKEEPAKVIDELLAAQAIASNLNVSALISLYWIAKIGSIAHTMPINSYGFRSIYNAYHDWVWRYNNIRKMENGDT